MRKLMFAAALALAALASAHAQTIPPGQNPSTVPDNNRDALIIRDPVKRDEALIAGANRRGNSTQSDPATQQAPHYSTHINTFKAQVAVTNNSAKTIKSVSWSASLTDSGTGALIRTYDVTTDERIAPGKTKKLTKKLPTPPARLVSVAAPANGKAPVVADLKTTVTRVTYEDGTTSETP